MTETVNTKTHTDIKRLAWIERLPPRWRPYAYLMRLDRPIGIWLLLLPGLWSIVLAGGPVWQTLYTVLLFTLGAIVMRGAGCIVNDLWDKDLDKQVERTRSRPLASGAVSVKNALLFLATLSLIGMIVLLQFNQVTVILGFLSLPLIALYPLMKRITWWPQAFLGITFNFAALMGWSAMTGSLGFSAILLYIGGIFWTLGYDTVYAHQDKEDDALAGIKSTAIKFGDYSKSWVSAFYALATVFFAFSALMAQGFFAAGFVIATCLHLGWQIFAWKPDDPANSLRIFKSNRNFGFLILAVLILCRV